MNLKIVLLNDGWVDLKIIMNEQSMMISFEYTPNDAFVELLMSSIQLCSYKDDFTIIFPNGSDRKLLFIKKIDKNYCKVSIGKHSEELSIKQFIRAVLMMFDKFAHDYSIEQYVEGWRHFFPQKELEILRANYRML